MTFDIIYEDNHLFVVNKPAGLLTQASGTGRLNLEDLCKQYIKETYEKSGQVFLHAIHRLDRPVSGVVIFAKTKKALQRLNASLREKKCKKVYLAWIENGLKSSCGTLENYLYHNSFKASVSNKNNEKAKLARLQYRTLKMDDKKTLVEVELETGRYHQIRAQFAFIGCPIVGDKKYGSSLPYQDGTIALQHVSLTVEHPTKKELMTFAVCQKNFSG